MERMMAKIDAWRKEKTACQEAMKPCVEKAKNSLEEMRARVDVFEEKLDAAGKACLGKTHQGRRR